MTTDTTQRSDRFPSGIPFIVGNEGAERFSFYGMRAILYVYLTSLFLRFVDEASATADAVSAAKAHATEVTHLFMAGVYAFPMIGAIIADRLFGKYRVIFWVSIIYVAGQAVLAIGAGLGVSGQFDSAEWSIYFGLTLVALGSGGIKPCVSANVGDQFTAENSHLVSKVFQIFYFIINFGSFLATLSIPLVRTWFGAEVAFAVPGVLMAIAAIVFWAGRGRFVRVPPKPGGKLGLLDSLVAILFFLPFAIFAFLGVITKVAGFAWDPNKSISEFPAFFVNLAWPHALASIVCLVLGVVLFNMRQRLEPDRGFLPVLLYALQNQKKRQPGQGFFDVARDRYSEEEVEGPPAVLRIMVVFSMVSVFWAIFDQHSSTWIEQAKQMDLTLNVPFYFGRFVATATVVLAVYGFVWLMLWVSNVSIPRKVNVAVGVLVVVAGVVIGAVQVSSGEWQTLTLQAAQIAALNPLMVMVIIPAMNFGVWRPLEARGITVKPLQKMTAGMFLSALSFVVAAVLQSRMQEAAPDKIPVLWQVLQYLIVTIAEVLVSVTGLEFAYTQAPRAMKSTIMGFWLLCVTVGNLLVAFVAPMQRLFPLSTFFYLFAALGGVAAVLFTLLAATYKGKAYLQQAKSP